MNQQDPSKPTAITGTHAQPHTMPATNTKLSLESFGNGEEVRHWTCLTVAYLRQWGNNPPSAAHSNTTGDSPEYMDNMYATSVPA